MRLSARLLLAQIANAIGFAAEAFRATRMQVCGPSGTRRPELGTRPWKPEAEARAYESPSWTYAMMRRDI